MLGSLLRDTSSLAAAARLGEQGFRVVTTAAAAPGSAAALSSPAQRDLTNDHVSHLA